MSYEGPGEEHWWNYWAPRVSYWGIRLLAVWLILNGVNYWWDQTEPINRAKLLMTTGSIIACFVILKNTKRNGHEGYKKKR